jgi:hypothetical protein
VPGGAGSDPGTVRYHPFSFNLLVGRCGRRPQPPAHPLAPQGDVAGKEGQGAGQQVRPRRQQDRTRVHVCRGHSRLRQWANRVSQPGVLCRGAVRAVASAGPAGGGWRRRTRSAAVSSVSPSPLAPKSFTLYLDGDRGVGSGTSPSASGRRGGSGRVERRGQCRAAAHRPGSGGCLLRARCE